jgi:hypothetical protein
MDSTIMYLLMKGPNTFFAPQISGTYNALQPTAYKKAMTALGAPLSALKCQPIAGKTAASGLCLYSREFQNGTIYLNWTGKAQQVVLPTTKKYMNASSVPVTSLSLSDLKGTYVLNR